MLPNATPITIAVPPMKAGTMKPVHVIGGGLAGSEAAWQLARAGVPVVLHEMRPERGTDAHQTDGLAELVCSNSFRSDDSESNAVGLLHEEMRRAGSLIMAAADKPPKYWPITEVKSAEAPPLAIRKPVRGSLLRTSLTGVTLSLGESVSLENSFPPAGAGIDPHNRCVKKNRGTTLFCLETVDWPEAMQPDSWSRLSFTPTRKPSRVMTRASSAASTRCSRPSPSSASPAISTNGSGNPRTPGTAPSLPSPSRARTTRPWPGAVSTPGPR